MATRDTLLQYIVSDLYVLPGRLVRKEICHVCVVNRLHAPNVDRSSPDRQGERCVVN